MAIARADEVGLTGDERIDGLVQGGKWSFAGAPVLTYAYYSEYGSWGSGDKAAFQSALQSWANVANIRFQQVSPTGAEDMSVVLSGDFDAAAFGFFPDPVFAPYDGAEGDVWFNADYDGFNFLNPGGDGYMVGLHEIGHALGLKHPHDDGGNARPSFLDLGIGLNDSQNFTVMSYNLISSSLWEAGNPASPMPYDILAIQHIYGANNSYHAGNDTYLLKQDLIVKTVWDAGGIDTFSAAGLPTGAVIDLTQGSFSSHGQLSKTAIAYNVVIENAIGSSFADTLTGNAANNLLDGKLGADVMVGGAGDDTYGVDHPFDSITEAAGQGTDTVRAAMTYVLGENFENLTLTGTAALAGTGNGVANQITGNAAANLLTGLGGDDLLDGAGGADEMVGGLGDDTYWVSVAGDVVTEAAGEGTDTVRSSVSYALGANLENLVLLGSAALGTGNELDNALTGSGAANTLDGGLGSDAMAGGGGSDIYKVDDAGDTVTEAAGGGADTVHSGVSFALGANVEHLMLTGGSDIDGTGNALANQLTGNAGANRLDGGAGADVMTGGLGDDTYVVDAAADKIVESSATGGTDTVESGVTLILGTNLENLALTGAGNLNATGNSAGNVLTGNAGNNLLDGRLGADSMAGGAGDDIYVVDDALDMVSEAPGEGTDTVRSSVDYTLAADLETLTLTGTGAIAGTGNADANQLTGNAGANLLTGLGGDDILDGAGGADQMAGGLGDDTYWVNAVTDVVAEEAGEGADTVRSTVSYALGANLEALVLLGSAALGTGNALDNDLTGNAAANTLDGGLGADAMAGGAGNDAYKVNDAGDTVTEAAAAGTDTVHSAVSYALGANLEHLMLTGGSDIDGTGNALANQLTGNAGANRLDGGAGADVMTGGLGADTDVVGVVGDKVVESSAVGGTDTIESAISLTLGANLENLVLTGAGTLNGTGNSASNVLTGNAGNNRLDGRLGADSMAGGAGDDTYVVDNASDSISEAPGQGADLVLSSVTHTLSVNVENLTLTGSAAINGTGNGQANLITGNAGANLLSGLAGADRLFAGGGSDRLDGGAGADEMSGGAGVDVFVLTLGEIEGDSILDFVGNGASLGDSLLFQGFGDDASLTHIGDLWTVLYEGGAESETFQIAGVSALATGDYLFA